MGAITTIPFCHHSWSPWRGCAHKMLSNGTPHPGCEHCYAEVMGKRNPRVLGTWGEDGHRPIGVESYLNLPFKWNERAKARGKRERVFPSLMDPFENRADLIKHRTSLFATIDACDWLDFLLFTKRPENVPFLWPDTTVGFIHRKNVWLVYSVSDQSSFDDGIQHLMHLRNLVPVLGISAEPLLGTINFSRWFSSYRNRCSSCGHTYIDEDDCCTTCGLDTVDEWYNRLDWVLVGGESGMIHRTMDMGQFFSVVEQVRAAHIPLFVKQDSGFFPDRQGRIPDDLWQIKQLPRVAA